MQKQIEAYLKLAKIYKDHGYSLYLVGGTVRDFLMGIELSDMDAVTDATPEQTKLFIPDVDMTFAKYGSLKYICDEIKFDITTLRVEKGYADERHPNKIKYVTSLKKDYVRRDFTMNAMYLNDRFELIDYVDGKKDVENKIIRMVGNPKKRIKEDPLRIFRAIRFAIAYGLTFDKKLAKYMKKYSYLLDKQNKNKIISEGKKFINVDEKLLISILDEFNIHHLRDVVK